MNSIDTSIDATTPQPAIEVSGSAVSSAVPESVACVMHDLGRAVHYEVLACVAIAPACVGTVCERLQLDKSTVSKSFSRLRACGLVAATRCKNNRFYRANTERVTVTSGGHLRVHVPVQRGGEVSFSVPLDDLPIDLRTWSVDAETTAPAASGDGFRTLPRSSRRTG